MNDAFSLYGGNSDGEVWRDCKVTLIDITEHLFSILLYTTCESYFWVILFNIKTQLQIQIYDNNCFKSI